MDPASAYILFQVADTTYAIAADVVQQMEMIEQVTKAPNTPAYVDGVVYLRGQVIPVINLRSRFGLERIDYDLRARLIVVNANGRVVGLAVDTAREYVTIADEQVLPPPAMLSEESGSFIQGMFPLDERLVMILDVSGVLTNGDTSRLEASGRLANRAEQRFASEENRQE